MAFSGNETSSSSALAIRDKETGSKWFSTCAQIASRSARVEGEKQWNAGIPNSARCLQRKNVRPPNWWRNKWAAFLKIITTSLLGPLETAAFCSSALLLYQITDRKRSRKIAIWSEPSPFGAPLGSRIIRASFLLFGGFVHGSPRQILLTQ